MAQISVIVPVYNVEKYLHRCVDSILGQSFEDFRLILIDDGSPDSCGGICDDYGKQDSRVHVIHQKNGGLSAARNAGLDWMLENETTPWVTFVDSDDWIDQDYLSVLYDAVRETGFPVAACEYRTTGGEPIRPEAAAVEPMTAEAYYCGGKILSVPVACAKLYSSALFQQLRFPTGKLHEDEFTTYRAIFAAKQVAYVPSARYAYYENPEGIIRSAWNPRRLHILEAVEQQIEDAEKWNNSSFYARAVNHYIHAIHEQLTASDKKYHKELRRKYRHALKLGRDCGVFPLCWERLWAYEEAYPAKLFWWPLFRGKMLADRFFGKEA